jgi:hypothetical protein
MISLSQSAAITEKNEKVTLLKVLCLVQEATNNAQSKRVLSVEYVLLGAASSQLYLTTEAT